MGEKKFQSQVDKLSTVPDISVPSEWLLWRSEKRAGILVELPPMDPHFAQKIAEEVGLGLRGRGSCLISERGRLFADFGVTDEEAASCEILIEYGHHLIKHLGVDFSAILIAEIEEITPDEEVIKEADEAIRRFGMHAIRAIE